MERSSTRFLPALEGVRGYAFIIVFLVHYQASASRPVHLWQYPWFLLLSTGWLVVPLFFALSGYLITQILCNSKDRRGYFKVFYGRRALRVFPLYYLTIGICMALAAVRHWTFNPRSLGFFLYLQNFARHTDLYLIGGHINVAHFWSLAVEEHFYLVWPIIVWLCASRRQLLKCCYAILIGCFAIRVAWPLLESFNISLQLAYSSTFTRVDGIICGAVVALSTGNEGIPRWVKQAAIATVIGGLGILFFQAIVVGHTKPEDYATIVWMTPLANFISTALLVLLLREETWLSRICSKAWICKLGSLSYGLYVFHYLYCDYFLHTLAPRWSPFCGTYLANILSTTLAFALTLLLAVLAHALIELPGQKAKHLLSYGPHGSGRRAASASTSEGFVKVLG